MALAKKYNMRSLKQKAFAPLSLPNYAMQNSNEGHGYFMSTSCWMTAYWMNLSQTVRSISKNLIPKEKNADPIAAHTTSPICNLPFSDGRCRCPAHHFLLTCWQKLQEPPEAATDQDWRTGKCCAHSHWSRWKGENRNVPGLPKTCIDGLGGMLWHQAFFEEYERLHADDTGSCAGICFNIEMLNSSIKEMRRVAHNMMPEILVRYGLDIAFKRVLQRA